ncbi:MAG: hypothetical protein ACXWLM_11750 [Myxococcales bacterium]
MRRLLPLALTAAFAAWSYWPAAGSVTGWGDDPLLSVWTWELVWHRLSTLGPLHAFSREFWAAPLFGGTPLGLAYSENEIFAALVFWPVRLLAGNGAVALGIAAIALTLAAFLAAGIWLRAVGVGRLCWWGGAIFACGGWIQSQYAHAQNLCTFVLPLALWAWSAFEARPTLLRALACGAAFGWIGGWNTHFQVFAAGCLLVLLARSWRTLPLPMLLALGACAFLVQLPIALKYASLSAAMGSYRSLVTYGASWLSFVGSGARPRLLLPSADVGIEAAGYLGVPWTLLALGSLRRPAARPWLLAAFFAYWISLGQGYGLFDLVALLPGIGALRATGRAQILVLLFTLPAVLGMLEASPPRFAAVALALVCLDLLPGTRTQRTRVAPELWGPQAPLTAELLRSDDPLLVLPDAGARVMLDLTQGWTPYFAGVSSRIPPGEELLRNVAASRPWTAHSLDDLLLLTHARRVLALTSPMQAELRASPRARERWCGPFLDLGAVCLFDVQPVEMPELRLDRDAAWSFAAGSRWPQGELRALRSGTLELRSLDGCRLVRHARVFGLPLDHEMPLMGSAIEGVRFAPGELILRVEARQALFRLPHTSATFAVRCGAG